MSAPYKNWEATSHRPVSNGYLDDLSYTQRPGVGPGVPVGTQPPPLPPRRRVQPASFGSTGLYSGYGGSYGSGYSGFGGAYASPFGSSLYSSSPYGMPFSSYNRTPFDSRYGGYGGEDGQSPFQSVESVVRAISSLSMMMESTYQSMFMSFRAVMGVAENMERLRRVILDLFGSIAIVKSVIWFFKKILYVMGLIKNNPSREKLWEAAAAEVMSTTANLPQQTRKTWPLVAFFGLMLGGPYVLYKLVSPQDGAVEWDPRQDGVQCIALYDFDTNQKGELPFRRGEVLVRRRSAQGGWALAAKKNGQTGYVPSDRLKPISEIKQRMGPKPSGRYYQDNPYDSRNYPQAPQSNLGVPGHSAMNPGSSGGWNTHVMENGQPLDSAFQMNTTVLPGAAVSVLPDNIPVLPDTSIPLLPDTSIPLLPDTSIPLLPDTSIPALPDTNIPVLPDVAIPALQDETIPSLPIGEIQSNPETPFEPTE